MCVYVINYYASLCTKFYMLPKLFTSYKKVCRPNFTLTPDHFKKPKLWVFWSNVASMFKDTSSSEEMIMETAQPNKKRHLLNLYAGTLPRPIIRIGYSYTTRFINSLNIDSSFELPGHQRRIVVHYQQQTSLLPWSMHSALPVIYNFLWVGVHNFEFLFSAITNKAPHFPSITWS